jgi:hypothetical protein
VNVQSLDRNADGCWEHGFLFTKIELNNKAFAALNIMFQFLLLLCCVGVLYIEARKVGGIWDEKGCGGLPKFSVLLFWTFCGSDSLVDVNSKAQVIVLQKFQSLTNIVIATMILPKMELTVNCNAITSVNSLSTGEPIPFAIGISLVVRVLCAIFFKNELEELHGPGSSAQYHHGSRGGHRDKVLAGIDEFISRTAERPRLASVDKFVLL